MKNDLKDIEQSVGTSTEVKHHKYLYGRKVQCNLYLPQIMIDWLRAQPIGMGKTLTRLIKAEMDKESSSKD